MKCKILIFLLAISTILATPTSITAPPISENSIGIDEKDDMKQFLGQCLHKSDVAKCLKNRVVELIDESIKSNDDWNMNFFGIKMALKRNPDFKENSLSAEMGRTFEDVISRKLKSLMESRMFQVKLSDDDEMNNNEEIEAPYEARKKKEGKHGHTMMMMSGKGLTFSKGLRPKSQALKLNFNECCEIKKK